MRLECFTVQPSAPLMSLSPLISVSCLTAWFAAIYKCQAAQWGHMHKDATVHAHRRDWHEGEKFTTTLVILSAPNGITMQLVWWSTEVTDKSIRISLITNVVVKVLTMFLHFILWLHGGLNQYLCYPLFILLGEPLRVCVHAGPSCCTSKMEDSYVAAVRSEMQHKMRSYSFELKYLIDGHRKAFQGRRVKEHGSSVDDK